MFFGAKRPRGRIRSDSMEKQPAASKSALREGFSVSQPLEQTSIRHVNVTNIRSLLKQNKAPIPDHYVNQYLCPDRNMPSSLVRSGNSPHRKAPNHGIVICVPTPKTGHANTTPSVNRNNNVNNEFLSDVNESVNVTKSARRKLDLSINATAASYFRSVFDQRILPTFNLKDDSINLPTKLLEVIEELSEGKMKSFPEYPYFNEDDNEFESSCSMISDKEWGRTHESLIFAKRQNAITLTSGCEQRCNVYENQFYFSVIDLIFQLKQAHNYTDNEICKKLQEHTEGIPRSTLQRWIKNYNSGMIHKKKAGRKPLLDDLDMQTLRLILKILYSKRYAPDTKETADFVSHFLEANPV